MCVCVGGGGAAEGVSLKLKEFSSSNTYSNFHPLIFTYFDRKFFNNFPKRMGKKVTLPKKGQRSTQEHQMNEVGVRMCNT